MMGETQKEERRPATELDESLSKQTTSFPSSLPIATTVQKQTYPPGIYSTQPSPLPLSPPLSSSSFPFTSPEGNVKSLHSGRMTSWEPPTDPLAADRGSPPATDAEKRGPQNPNMKQISRRWINESGRKERTIHTEKERNKRKSEWMRRRNSRCFFK